MDQVFQEARVGQMGQADNLGISRQFDYLPRGTSKPKLTTVKMANPIIEPCSRQHCEVVLFGLVRNEFHDFFIKPDVLLNNSSKAF